MKREKVLIIAEAGVNHNGNFDMAVELIKKAAEAGARQAPRCIAARAEAWIEAQLAKAMGGIVGLQALAQESGVEGNVRALAVQLADAGGIAGRHYLADPIAGLVDEGFMRDFLRLVHHESIQSSL